jgi:hypothetical protein
MENIKLRQLAIEFFENHLNPTEDNLYKFLEDNAWKIYADYQKQSFENIIRMELDEQDFNVKDIPEYIIQEMGISLEETLLEENHFRDCINDTIDWYKEDLAEYKLEEK